MSLGKPIALFAVIIFFSRSEHAGKGFAFYEVNINLDLLGEKLCFISGGY